MDRRTAQASDFLKILIPFAIIYGIIFLAKSGYAFGQWLQQLVN